MGRVSLAISFFLFLPFINHCRCHSRRYPIKDATWETEDSMTDPVKLIEDFNRAAKAEGILHDTHSTVFLREAREGGWRDPDE